MVELDQDAFFDFLNLNEQSGAEMEEALVATNGEIVVQGRRDRYSERPSLSALREAFRNRRIVVRGTGRLEVAFVGARRDFRRKSCLSSLMTQTA